jgi:hypothetical protein
MSFADGGGAAEIDAAVSAKQMTKHEWRIEFLSFRAKSRNLVVKALTYFRGILRLRSG